MISQQGLELTNCCSFASLIVKTLVPFYTSVGSRASSLNPSAPAEALSIPEASFIRRLPKTQSARMAYRSSGGVLMTM